MSTNRMDKKSDKIERSNENEPTTTTCNNTDESQDMILSKGNQT